MLAAQKRLIAFYIDRLRPPPLLYATLVINWNTTTDFRKGDAMANVICLLPVRNGANDLPMYLDSVSRYVDGVIALDDGSTDETTEILQNSPIVLKILHNPRRDTYVGWNDLQNRMRLLKEAEYYGPDWIIWLDADEILEPSDASVLRHFIERQAIHRTAYAFEVLRMIDDLTTYDKCAFWVPRLYSFENGYSLPERNLHFYLIPEQFSNQNPVNTSLRIMHRAGVTEARRTARFDKYNECDPERQWQDSYDNILMPPGTLKQIQPRNSTDPIILDFPAIHS
jgi:glycosyltransferase involved in cell wall biosynthesis